MSDIKYYFIRHGILHNGLSYFIMHNEGPKNRAEFHIAQKVGSILEEDNQRGLAHFLERMAFNGTAHFPRKTMLEYLQNNGLRFGSDINTYTGFDETVYRISNIPTERETLLDSTLLILYDWACGISLLDDEIEKERSAIQEEWRTRNDATQRMHEAVLPEIFRGSKYANRLPLGSMDVIMHFEPDELRKYYHRWYRPDQQGIILVGDFNVAEMEKKVINLFTKIKAPTNAPTREYFTVPDHKGIDYALYTDPEASMELIYLYFQHPAIPLKEKNTRDHLRRDIINMLCTSMLYARFNEIAQKKDAPFIYAIGQDGPFFISATKDAFSLIAMTKEGYAFEAFKVLLTEVQRVNLHGFTPSEFNRAKASVKASVENKYAKRNSQKNLDLAQSIINFFTRGGYLPGIEIETKEAMQILSTITITEVSEFIKNVISEDNVSLIISGQEKDNISYPTKEDITLAFREILSNDVSAYIDNIINQPLISTLEPEGEIINESYNNNIDATVWKLSNGATVYLKPTNFKNDEIYLSAISNGGTWAYNGKSCPEIKLMSDIVGISALGDFFKSDLNKHLAGKYLGISFSLESTTENILGSCAKNDFETLLQLNYLMFTNVNKDTQSFEALKSRLKSQIALYENNPSYIFRDSVYSTLYNHNPLIRSFTTADIDSINYDKCLSLYKQRVSNAGDFTFSIVGSFNIDSIRPLVTKYIASLPDNGIREKTSFTLECSNGIISNYFTHPMVSPKTNVYACYSGNMKYSVYNDMIFGFLRDIMAIKYIPSLREAGEISGANVDAYISQYNDEWAIAYQFSANAQQCDSLINIANRKLCDILKDGADKNEFLRVKEVTIKQYENSLHTNAYWISVINDIATGNDSYSGFKDMLQSLTLEEFNSFLKTLNIDNNITTVVMTGITAD